MAPMVLSCKCNTAAGTPCLGDTDPWRAHGHGTYKAIMHQQAVPRGCPILGTQFPEGHAIPMVPSH